MSQASPLAGPVALRFRGVRKRFGAIEALAGLNLDVPRGSFFGLVGPNGAGKTTAFSLACGFLRPDVGEVEILDGRGYELPRLKGRVGAMPQDATLGRETRCLEHLRHFAQLQGMTTADARREADTRLAEVGLGDRGRARVATLSHGMVRRLAVAQALLGSPELVLLDEPTSGLDPRHAHELRELLAGVRAAGRTIVISSHNLDELERLCDHVAFIQRGVVVAAGPTDVVTGRGAEIEIDLGTGPTPIDELRAALVDADVQIVWEAEQRRLRLVARPRAGREIEDVIGLALRALLAGGARIAGVRRGSSLEQKFLALG